jgi:hypothetical protein
LLFLSGAVVGSFAAAAWTAYAVLVDYDRAVRFGKFGALVVTAVTATWIVAKWWRP